MLGESDNEKSAMQEAANGSAELGQRISPDEAKEALEDLGYTVREPERAFIRTLTIRAGTDEAIGISVANIHEFLKLPPEAKIFELTGVKIVTAPPDGTPEQGTEFIFRERGEVEIQRPGEAWKAEINIRR